NTRPGVGFGVGAVQGDIVNEMGQVVQPLLPGGVNAQNPTPDPLLTGNKSFGRGSALEIGLGNPIPNDKSDIVLPARAQASAPPDRVPPSPGTDNVVAPVPVNLLAYAELLRAQAAARWDHTVNNALVGAPSGAGT